MHTSVCCNPAAIGMYAFSHFPSEPIHAAQGSIWVLGKGVNLLRACVGGVRGIVCALATIVKV